ncbi:MAG: ABC transporter permease [Anaerolineae bacterium]|nr:ABC transporter permease [Anaerolineae bacterium]
MSNILTIAKREITRLKSRFKGGSRLAVILILAGASVISYLAFQQGSVLSNGLYRVGVSPDGPGIHDSRFSTVTVARSLGYSMLNAKSLDVYIDRDQVVHTYNDKSLYAAGALELYLEKQELARIKDQYEIDRAFPLRIEVNYLPAPTGQGVSPLELADALMGGPEEPAGVDPGAGQPAPDTTQFVPRETDAAVIEQIRELESGGRRPRIEIEFASDKEIIIPSLMNPPIPFAQVIIAFLYVLPVSFVSIFFTSSFMDEKIGRRITVLMSAPVTPFEIIAGKMLPYASFSLVSVVIITLALKGNLLLALAIFIPVILFILAIYLMVPLVYRTFRDTTFISMLATTLITSYLVFPAMFSGVNDLSYMSPLTLIVKMYREEPFGLKEYLFSTASMYLIFALSMYIATRILNEEYLMGFRPLYRKAADAIYLGINRNHLYVSITLLSLFLIPIVYMIQLVTLAISLNLPLRYAVGGLLMVAVVIEEIAKSVGIVVLLEHRVIETAKDVVILSFLSAVGFLGGEKLLLLISLSVVFESALSPALFSSGLLLIPLIAHFVSTATVCLLTKRFGVRAYPYAVLAGSIVHALYNLYVLGAIP